MGDLLFCQVYILGFCFFSDHSAPLQARGGSAPLLDRRLNGQPLRYFALTHGPPVQDKDLLNYINYQVSKVNYGKDKRV